MATFNDKAVVDRIIKNDGWYYQGDRRSPDNPRAVRVVEYTNAWGGQCYGVVFEGEGDIYRYEQATEYVRSPKLLWAAT